MAVDHSRTFAVVLDPEEKGGFAVRVPSLPEIVTYGKDEHEALAMAEDAIRLVLEDSAARGEPTPDGGPPRIREVTITLVVSRTSGGHCRLVHANDPARRSRFRCTGADLKRGTLRGIIAQAGLTVAEFIELL